MTKDNMNLWNSVSESDPASLKRVSFGQRSFTAIDPQHQIMKATEVFGPVGEGWGWNANINYVNGGDEVAVVANVTIWHGSPANNFGPFPGCRTFYKQTKKGMQFMEDAPKMAVTDGLTKGLSHLGFNADVFLGKHDGNKYSDPNAMKENSQNEGGW